MHNARLEYKTHTPFKDKMANIDTLKRLKNHCQVTPSTSKRKREKNWTVTRALANVPFLFDLLFVVATMTLVRLSGTLQFN